MENVNYLMKLSSFQREGHSLITLRTIEAHQENTWGQIKGMQALHASWSLSATLPLNHCYKTPRQGLPWWHSGWESACQCRGHGFKPWSGKIPHAAEQLGPWATIAEPARLEPVLRNKRGRNSERRGTRTAMKSGPRLPQLEKALAQKRRPNTAIN